MKNVILHTSGITGTSLVLLFGIASVAAASNSSNKNQTRCENQTQLDSSGRYVYVERTEIEALKRPANGASC